MLNQTEEAKSTRERVLYTLLTHEKCTINDMAEAVNINPISVRHHITKLESDGLVDSVEEKHGVGRPRRVYFLSELGQEHFPTRYLRLTLRLLEQLKDSMPQPMVDKLFMQMAQEVANEYKSDLDGLSMNQRLDLLTGLLTNEGFTVDWELHGDLIHIRESSCPYIHIGQDHPEVCNLDQTLISTLLNVPAQKIKCRLHGDTHCTYIVPNLIPLEKTTS
jgi:DeoR family suf operon transcriptional repressor